MEPGQTIAYVVGVYDSKTKAFKPIPAPITEAESAITNISALGLGKIGVQEILWESGTIIAKSAIRVVTVKA